MEKLSHLYEKMALSHKYKLIIIYLLFTLGCKTTDGTINQKKSFKEYLDLYISNTKFDKEIYAIIMTTRQSDDERYSLSIENVLKAVINKNDTTFIYIGNTKYREFEILFLSDNQSVNIIRNNLKDLKIKRTFPKFESNDKTILYMNMSNNPVRWTFYIDHKLNYLEPYFEYKTKFDSIVENNGN